MAQNSAQLTPLFTANNVDIWVNGGPYGFCENITITRSVNRQPRFAVGDPRYKDAPPTTITVSVQLTGMVPQSTLSGNTVLQNNAHNAVHDSLVSEVGARGVTIAVHEAVDTVGTALYQIDNCVYNNDAVAVAAGDIVSYNLSFIAPDSSVWQV